MLGYDWFATFYPATWAFLRGADPYAVGVAPFVSPPWILPLLVPLALLPPAIGAWAMMLAAVAVLVLACGRRGRLWVALPLALSYPMLVLLYHTNVDTLPLLGLVVGGPLGLLLLSLKPQVAGLVGVVWAAQAYQRRGLVGVLALVGPTLLLALVFTARYPYWITSMLHATQMRGAQTFNLWPWLVPLGAGFLAVAVRQRRDDFASVATVLISPYVRITSWLASLVLLSAEYPALVAGLAILSWAAYLFRLV